MTEEKSVLSSQLGDVVIRAKKKKHLIWAVPLIIIVLVGIFFAVGLVFPLLWKVTISDIFGVKEITFWQAWALIIMAQILFKANINVQKRMKKA
jgi:hypothetical protein